MVTDYKELRNILKISSEINSFKFLKLTLPLVKKKYNELQDKILKIKLDYPFNILIEYISLHFEIFDIEINKEKLTEHYEEVLKNNKRFKKTKIVFF